ncbi:serine--tRNA ligase [Candidatus Saccharibacteria bacterium]|nr:serine--tRNA ligase [Candidatus Saccharibacteria bacterium]
MLDIRFIRENAELVAEKSKQKGYEVNIAHLLELDKKRREAQKWIDSQRENLNKVSKDFQKKPPSAGERESIRQSKEIMRQREKELDEYDKEYWPLLKSVPNMPADDVPVGSSEEENVVSKEWGDKPKLDFKPKTHWEVAEACGWIDKERAAKVSGSRFAYILGDLVKLQFALVQFTIATLTNEETLKKIIQDSGLKDVSSRPFVPVLPPAMIRTEVFEAMDRLEPREERYQVGTKEDNLWLQGSAEHTLGPFFMNEVIAEDDLPTRFLGYLTSFRREAGSYGKDIEGIIRMHQFDKLEMESFTTPKQGMNEHFFFVAIQEYLMQQLNIPYRVLNKCTADIGKPNARGIDLEAWLPSQNKYVETHTADFMTDYQARRLGTRYKKIGEGGTELVHTNDATAFAPGRTIVAVIENYQTEGGKVGVPVALRPYMGGQLTL